MRTDQSMALGQDSAFEVIPVIDLRGGAVVRAVMGRRDLYRPIETPLAASSDPVAVAAGLMGLHPFGKLYVADLDAIEATGNNGEAIAALARAYPHLEIWVDNAAASPQAVRRWVDAGWGALVIGSESQASDALLRQFQHEPRIVLSLDFRGDAFQGPAGLLEPSAWPPRVVAMTLARVGGGAGPDFDRLAALRRQAPGQALYAAGGVRGRGDLSRLAGMGLAGVLVASALHDGRLAAADLTEWGNS